MNKNNPQKYVFHVSGMHCNACVLMTESEIGDLPHVSSVKSSLKNNSVEIVGDFGERGAEQIADELSILLKPHGYALSVERHDAVGAKLSDFKIALPIALGFAVLFVALQKAGLVNLVSSGNVTYGTAFVIGIIASLSTCMAVVGGLVLSMSATFAREGDRVRPQLMFHGGRLVSFFVLGGIIGALGAAFTLSASATFALSLVIGIVMLILGINLLDVFPWAKRLQPSMPEFIARRAHGMARLNHTLTPLLVGIATFFLPCGFTQSMQLYTLSTGSFFAGGLTMLAFALGTLPVLALVSFSSISVKGSPKAGVFFKAAGLIVILFALFNVINSLVVIGLIPPVFNF
ncbi:MAG: sulfite exporter TauE/SafE family protein [Candidatus Paceibacterota bacterium]|jgi:sulfite exporter TauE/SafE/copper chaperone CopZ